MSTPPSPASPATPAPNYRRVTKSYVRTIDSAMRIIVTIGGIGVVVCVMGIMVYLAANVAPLFKAGSASRSVERSLTLNAPPLALGIDEYRGVASVLTSDGILTSVTLDHRKSSSTAKRASVATGTQPSAAAFSVERVIPAVPAITAASQRTESGQFAVGFADGTVRLATLEFKTDFLQATDIPPQARTIDRGGRIAYNAGFLERTPIDQYRATTPSFSLAPAVEITEGTGAIARLDLRASASAQYLGVIREDGTGVFNRVSFIRPLSGGEPRAKLESESFAFVKRTDGAPLPDYFFVTGSGASIFCLWKDGRLDRYSRVVEGGAEREGFVKAETVNVVPAGRTVSTAAMLLGAETLVIADDRGDVVGGFVSRANTLSTPDQQKFVVVHRFEGVGSPVGALGISLRDRSFLVASSDGGFSVRHMTSHKEIADLRASDGYASPSAPVLAVIAPKVDGFASISANGTLRTFELDAPEREASVYSLAGKVWYEGDAGPSYTWQSSAGEDTAEIKYSLTPLIFGTLKATIYAMLFAAPIAIFAAIYTSEILHHKVRNTIKPVIEMMASLPSVVLGFIAAMVIAPFARDVLPAILLAFFTVPVGALLAAYLWQLVPTRITAALSSTRHLAMVALVMAISVASTALISGPVERWLFSPSEADVLVLAGSTTEIPRSQWPASLQDSAYLTPDDARVARLEGFYVLKGKLVKPAGSVSNPALAPIIAQEGLAEPSLRRWLDGSVGSAWSGWFLLMTPASFILITLLRQRFVDELMTRNASVRVGVRAASIQLVKFAITLAGSILCAMALASLLSSMGMDARDSLFGSYSQRNTLVVAIVMGFAIIPIIYTISEDALSAVPGSLRSASLGCGATRWQTAIKVVLPIAGSGIFSACMIGLGRAAGETMIVLMATGNTPVMDLNIFSGFRTLSANIAVELPEAAKDSTHYRVLFLGALCLFVLTFVVNTIAEIVRQRFRKRSAAL